MGMTDTDKANALDWLNEIVTNPDGWRMFYSDSETKSCAEAAIALLKEQEAVKWISVNERLPKSAINKVLVYLQHDDLASYIGFGHYEKYNGVELWYDLENNKQFSNREYTVTHWMPLPTPPEEGR